MLSDRLSTTLFDANALRFKLATFAFILVELIRQSLAGTKLAKARPETLRLRLFRIGAKVKISTRRVHIAMSSAFPDKDLFGKSWRSLVPPPLRTPSRERTWRLPTEKVCLELRKWGFLRDFSGPACRKMGRKRPTSPKMSRNVANSTGIEA